MSRQGKGKKKRELKRRRRAEAHRAYIDEICQKLDAVDAASSFFPSRVDPALVAKWLVFPPPETVEIRPGVYTHTYKLPTPQCLRNTNERS